MKEWKFMTSIKLIKIMVQGLMAKPKKDKSSNDAQQSVRIRANFIDKAKIEAQKQRYQDHLNGIAEAATNLFKSKTDNVEFVSTQDIITSSWFNASSSRLPMNTFNLRERCPALPKNLAGNYETTMLLDPPSYENASLIRKSLLRNGESFKRANPMPLPGFCGKTSCAFITTWCFSVEGKAAGLYLEGCEQVLHMPIMPVSILKTCPMDFAVVFRASLLTGEQGIIMFCKQADDHALANNADSVLGEVVNRSMFH